MVNEQINQGAVDYVPCKSNKKQTPRTPYFRLYYTKNSQKYLLSKQKHRAKKRALKPKKPRSQFVKQREQNFINCLDKHHITVAIPRSLKIKHPIIRGWNKLLWWCKQTIRQLLQQGWNYFTLLNRDHSYKGVRIGCIDIDQKGWTKIPTKYWTCYITANNGKIKLLFLYKDSEGLKTGKGYFKGQPILDFKVSGGIMGIGSFHPNGQPYQVKGAGSFFLKNNHVFNNPYEVAELLKQDFGIEYKTIREHFFVMKNKEKVSTENNPIPQGLLAPSQETHFIPNKGPPRTRWKGNNLSKAVS